MEKPKDIRDAVEAELVFDPLIDASDIHVKTLVPGEITLTGTVPSYPQSRQASDAARRVASVTMVHNHLEVVLPMSSYRDDALLTTSANNALALDITVPAGIEATAHHGNLRLTGTVSYGFERRTAEQAVAGLTGVRKITNHVNVVTAASQVDVSFLVHDALNRYAMVSDQSNVRVTTNEHTATLDGHVRTWAEHGAVVDAAWMARGVYDVQDRLVVTG